MKPIPFILCLLLGLSLSGLQARLGQRDNSPTRPSVSLRLLGPASELGRSLQWVRFQRALLRGNQPRALALAESAIALDPSATDGWQLLAAHLGYFLASPEREHAPERRRMWLQAALEVTRRGAQQASHPEELHLQRGLMLLSKLDLDPQVDPAGPTGLLAGAIEALRQAAQLGSPAAQELLVDLGASAP